MNHSKDFLNQNIILSVCGAKLFDLLKSVCWDKTIGHSSPKWMLNWAQHMLLLLFQMPALAGIFFPCMHTNDVQQEQWDPCKESTANVKVYLMHRSACYPCTHINMVLELSSLAMLSQCMPVHVHVHVHVHDNNILMYTNDTVHQIWGCWLHAKLQYVPVGALTQSFLFGTLWCSISDKVHVHTRLGNTEVNIMNRKCPKVSLNPFCLLLPAVNFFWYLVSWCLSYFKE